MADLTYVLFGLGIGSRLGVTEVPYDSDMPMLPDLTQALQYTPLRVQNRGTFCIGFRRTTS